MSVLRLERTALFPPFNEKLKVISEILLMRFPGHCSVFMRNIKEPYALFNVVGPELWCLYGKALPPGCTTGSRWEL